MTKERRKPKRHQRWFVPAEITQNTIFMMGAIVRFFLLEWPKRGLGGHIRHYFTYNQGDFSQMWYRRDEFDAQAEFLSNKMLRNPTWALRVIADVERWSNRFIEASRSFRRLPFADMTDRELIAAFNRVYRWHELSHGIGASVSWHADADQERITKAISARIEERIAAIGHTDPAPVVFSQLSTPTVESFATQEERELLKLAGVMFGQPGARALVRKTSGVRLEAAIQKKQSRLASRLRQHYERWRWLQYGYKGPDYPMSYFLDRLQALSYSPVSPQRLHRELIAKSRITARRQRSLEHDLKLTEHDRMLVELSRRLVFIKEYRKGALYHGMYCYEPFFREVGRRLKLSLDQIWAMNTWEILESLEKRRPIVPKQEISARLREVVMYTTRRRYVMLTGRKARTFLRAIPKEKTLEAGEVSELTGTCACPGSATGCVKIVEVPDDMKKMDQGDILVSETTYPSLVPAMKKAAAIVTNAGGLTCHAAIVSRELGIPCVVGTKIANKVLKDGDKVEVDATKGIVRKVR